MDLWQLTEGHCSYERAGKTDLGVSVVPAAEGVALALAPGATPPPTSCFDGLLGRQESATGSRGWCSASGLPPLLSYADLLGATYDATARRLRFVHCPKSSSGRGRQDVVLSVDMQGLPGAMAKEKEVAQWAASVCGKCAETSPRRYYVLVNPASGSGQSPSIWKTVEELWGQLPWLQCEVVETTRIGDAADRVRTLKLEAYSGIIVVSGDGLIYEVLNGLAERPDRQRALQTSIGHIPGGSGNALAKNILHARGEAGCSPLEAAFRIAKGAVQPMHLMRVKQAAQPLRVSFLSLSAAICSDIDIESEKLRFLGGSRFTVWALYRVMRPRMLQAQLTYWPVDAAQPLPAEPDLQAPLSGAPWVSVEDNFSFFYALNMPWVATDAWVSPDLKAGESIWHLVLMKRASRLALVKCLLGLETASHLKEEGVEVVPVRAFRLAPRVGTDGILSLDGERVSFEPIQIWPETCRAVVLG